VAKTIDGDHMGPRARSASHDREATTRRFSFALFIVAELVCTGALVAAAIHWM